MFTRGLHNVPIRRKLRLIVLTTCTAALCAASVALFAMQFLLFQRDYRRDFASVAEIMAELSAEVLSQGSPKGATGILSTLRAKPHIIAASLLLRDGTVFAQFGSLEGAEELNRDATRGFHRVAGELGFVQPIVIDGNRVGTLVLRSDYRSESRRLLTVYAGILAAVLSISFLIGLFVSLKLEPFISDPLLELAATARRIAEGNDYSLRARQNGRDEVAACADAFNAMLDQIESRDLALRHEIEERSRTEGELQRVHGQLLDASRQAGMAEVATGVLHNVGNVLNSVNVSATVISETLGTPRLDNVVKAAQMLREREGDLAGFLTEDPRGRLVPRYLAEASEHLAGERRVVQAELASLAKNIEHIKDIVSMQQSYARVSGFIETLPADALIEDALQMSADTFARAGIQVVRDFEAVPAVAVDKHKVLQIIVNVLRNAKLALHDAAADGKQVRIGLRQKDQRSVEISMTDNGIGIPSENLTRIFSHGFTTRTDGHGFGLHSAALAAQQMGGRLTATSEGRGYGATFTLELPLAA